MAQTRKWLRLGASVVDIDRVVKIAFDRKEARLFASAGEALLMIAWTEERAQIAHLKSIASDSGGWARVLGDADDPAAADQRVRLASVDRLVSTNGDQGASAELFADGVFVGRVVGEAAVSGMEERLGIEP